MKIIGGRRRSGKTSKLVELCMQQEKDCCFIVHHPGAINYVRDMFISKGYKTSFVNCCLIKGRHSIYLVTKEEYNSPGCAVGKQHGRDHFTVADEIGHMKTTPYCDVATTTIDEVLLGGISEHEEEQKHNEKSFLSDLKSLIKKYE